MRVNIILSLLGIAGLSFSAASQNYAVGLIPKDLLKNANAVVRVEELQFEIKSPREAITTNRYAVTILNEAGERWADFSEYYDKHRDISSIDGYLYDAGGKQLKKIKKKDVEDISGTSESNLIDDNRVKRHSFYHKVYPYTVEYISEIVNKATLFFPSWAPQGGEFLAVEKSSLTVICNENYTFRHKAFLYKGEPVVSRDKSKVMTTWSVSNMPAISRESFSPMWHELSTVVILGPTEFQMDDYKGNMATWQDFGKFVHALKIGKDQLPDPVKQTVHSLTSGVSDIREKVSRLYAYMQKNTRYISIQLGIGGWQPFEAKFVATKGYGDCKALTNYMYSLLKEAGIPSYYALIRAGANATYITEDFPSQQFNHVILCVPLQKDSMWLECTSQTMPAGYLGDFTSGRHALLVDENGGRMVRTPKYGVNENLQVRKVKALLDEEGTLEVNTQSQYRGTQQDRLHGIINNLSQEKVRELLSEDLDFPTYDIAGFNYREEPSALPVIHESLDIVVRNYASITGKRLFITPNVMTKSYRKLNASAERKTDILLGYDYKDVDSVEIELPKGYEPESVPAAVNISSPYGKYSCSVKLSGNKLYYYRSIEQYSGRFPAKDYQELVKYYDAVYKADRNRVVLVRNEQPLKAF